MKAFIKTVRTNVKSPDGETREWTIGKNTLLLGKNESGKSTIAEAIQLSLSGAVSGILLRPGEVKKEKTLHPSSLQEQILRHLGSSFLTRPMPSGN